MSTVESYAGAHAVRQDACDALVRGASVDLLAASLLRRTRATTPRELAADADLLRGLAWGRGRFGHPEARAGLHVASILASIGGYPRKGE
jgi:hypothetical protein